VLSCHAMNIEAWTAAAAPPAAAAVGSMAGCLACPTTLPNSALQLAVLKLAKRLLLERLLPATAAAQVQAVLARRLACTEARCMLLPVSCSCRLTRCGTLQTARPAQQTRCSCSSSASETPRMH
jgi:hypothetical protein